MPTPGASGAAREAAYHDPDAAQVRGPERFPEVELFDPRLDPA
jgi:hypothetical protein